jgi:glyoxylase-like metal-dependent hydrolase (beta-lactamase superfamily II)
VAGPPPRTWAVDPAEAGAREIVPGLFRLRLPVAWESMDHVNAYLERTADGVTLFDTGSAGHPTCAEALERAVAQTGHALSDVTRLVVTHAHSDHMGLAPLVLRESRAELYAHPAGAHFYDAVRDPAGIEAKRERRARREGVPEHRLEAFRTTAEEREGALGALAPDHALVDGVSAGGWRVHETPGHAPSHVCLVKGELALVGDLVCAAFAPWLDYGYSPDPLAETLASLDTLHALDAKLALPGHGRPIADVAGVVRATRAGYADRLERTRAALAQGPAGAYVLTTRIFGEEPDLPAASHMTELLAYLRHLRLRGEITREIGDDGTFRYR